MSLFGCKNGSDNQAKLDAIGRSMAVIEFQTDGTIVTANSNFLAALGYSLQDIQGKHHSMFVDPAEVASPDYKKFWGDLASGEFRAGEFKRLGKGGKEVWIEASYNPVLDSKGNAYKVVKFATDVTAKKLQFADLQGQVNAINKSQAVIEFKTDGTILNANDNFLGTLGYTLAEIKGKHHSMFVVRRKSQAPLIKSSGRLWGVASFRRPSTNGSVRAVRKSGLKPVITLFSI